MKTDTCRKEYIIVLITGSTCKKPCPYFTKMISRKEGGNIHYS